MIYILVKDDKVVSAHASIDSAKTAASALIDAPWGWTAWVDQPTASSLVGGAAIPNSPIESLGLTVYPLVVAD
jgi:hypothetical protein